jgi:hypothetical protein
MCAFTFKFVVISCNYVCVCARARAHAFTHLWVCLRTLQRWCFVNQLFINISAEMTLPAINSDRICVQNISCVWGVNRVILHGWIAIIFTIDYILQLYLSVICFQTKLVLKPETNAFGSGQNEPPPPPRHSISTIILAAVINQDNKAR